MLSPCILLLGRSLSWLYLPAPADDDTFWRPGTFFVLKLKNMTWYKNNGHRKNNMCVFIALPLSLSLSLSLSFFLSFSLSLSFRLDASTCELPLQHIRSIFAHHPNQIRVTRGCRHAHNFKRKLDLKSVCLFVSVCCLCLFGSVSLCIFLFVSVCLCLLCLYSVPFSVGSSKQQCSLEIPLSHSLSLSLLLSTHLYFCLRSSLKLASWLWWQHWQMHQNTYTTSPSLQLMGDAIYAFLYCYIVHYVICYAFNSEVRVDSKIHIKSQTWWLWSHATNLHVSRSATQIRFCLWHLKLRVLPLM